MTTSPSEPVENDQSDADDTSADQEAPEKDRGSEVGHSSYIEDSQLPEDLRPGPDNPLASEDADLSGGPKPGGDDVVPEGEAPPGDPSIG